MDNQNKPNPPEKKNIFSNGDFGRIVWSAFKLFLVMVLAIGFLVAGLAAGFVAAIVKDEPLRTRQEIEQKINENDLRGFAYFADGSMIGEFRADADRRLVELDEISDYVKEGFIATEDKLFKYHKGINVRAIGRATIQDLTNAPTQTGGSTITQQLIKLTILTPEVSKARKFKEIFLALRVERMLSKDQILKAYLNEIPFGRNANNTQTYGIQAAAKGIFGVNADELNLPQSAFLVGIPNNPNKFNPFSDYEKGKERQELVLANMLEDGYISQKEHDDAVAFDIKASLAKPTTTGYQTHTFLMYEIEQRATEIYLQQQGIDLTELSGEEYSEQFEAARRDLLRKGYKIHTTIDPAIHETMNKVVTGYEKYLETQKYYLKDKDGKQLMNEDGSKAFIDNMEDIGSVLIDNRSGAILGFVGGRDAQLSKKNKATRMIRQPGSTMKPVLAYGPAIEEGLVQPATVIDDAPLLLKNNGANYYPLNWNNRFTGMVTAREALEQSLNIPAIKTYLKVGPEIALSYLKSMGVTSIVESDYHAQTAPIGGLAGITIEEMTNTYSTLANKGMFVDAYLIDRIETNDGDIFYKHEVQPKPVFSEQTAWLVTDMLRDVVRKGTGAAIGSKLRGWDIAGKTGTTNQDRDAWFIGYTPTVTLGMWNGYEYSVTLKGKYENKKPYNGTGHTKELWAETMKQLFELKPELSPKEAKFDQPDGLVQKSVCAKSGMLPTPACEAYGLVTDWFNAEDIPTELDNRHIEGRMVQFDGKMYLAQESTPEDMVVKKVGIQRPEPYTIPAPEERRDLAEEKWRPLDWELELPAEIDPREGSGQPDAPTGVTVTGTNGAILLGWTAIANPNIVGYRIYRSDTGEDNFTQVGSVRVEEPTAFTDAAGKTYSSYYVTAVEVAGMESSPSDTVQMSGNIPDPLDGDNGDGDPGEGSNEVPSSPVGVQVTSELVGATISWNANDTSENVTEYRIYYSAAQEGPYQLIGNTQETSYTHISFQGEGWYYVTAVNDAGESSSSNTVHLKASE